MEDQLKKLNDLIEWYYSDKAGLDEYKKSTDKLNKEMSIVIENNKY